MIKYNKMKKVILLLVKECKYIYEHNNMIDTIIIFYIY